MELLRDATEYVTITYPIKRYIPADANDDYVVAPALQTNSGFISSGDSDILSQKKALQAKYKKLKILTRAEFETMFAGIING